MPPKREEGGNTGGTLSPRTSAPTTTRAATASTVTAAAAAAAAAPTQTRNAASHDQKAVPQWVNTSVAILVALLIALCGTAAMLASPEDLDAAWRYKGVLLSGSYWQRLVLDGVETLRYTLAGMDADSAGMDGRLGKGDSALASPQGKSMMAALAKTALKQPPPPDPSQQRREHATTAAEADPPSAAKTGAPPPGAAGHEDVKHLTRSLACFTLEAYSDRFIGSPRQVREGRSFYRCGTRLVDLRAVSANEKDADAVSHACAASVAAQTAAPHLRIVLTPREIEWHAKQKLNLGAQVLPLSRLNDNYCDCMDGTDEMATGACSMSGPGMPLGAERWREYVLANQGVLLYEDEVDEAMALATAAAKRKVAAGTPPQAVALTSLTQVRTSLGLHTIGGPVLPFRCPGDTETWLSPTMLGDGIVDCCDGSDEAVGVWTALYGGEAAASNGVDAHGVAGAWEATRHAWTARRDAFPSLPASPAANAGAARGSYEDPIHPHYTSALAVLVDKGYTSLFACPVVHQQRYDAVKVLLELSRKGHVILQQRERDGWEKLGRAVLANQSVAAEKLGNLSRRVEERKNAFTDLMERKRTRDPFAAGITTEEMQQLDNLIHQSRVLDQEASYLGLIATQKVFGDHYEYYPLFANTLTFSPKHITDSYATDVVKVRRERIKRRMSLTETLQRQRDLAQFEQYAAAARAQGMEVPPPPPALHVDNISIFAAAVITARVGLVGQVLRTDAERETIARGKGLVATNAVYDRAALESAHDPFMLAPSFVLGHWQPYRVDRNATVMAVLDPAGDVDLPRRFSITPTSRLTRGGGRLQTPTRKKERDRTLSLKSEDDNQSGSKAEAKSVDIAILYHRNTPNVLSTHNFDGGSLLCELDPAPQDTEWERREQVQETSLRVAYGCAESDKILAWARNGKCQHEVIVGTPSACTSWVLRDLEHRAKRYSALLD